MVLILESRKRCVRMVFCRLRVVKEVRLGGIDGDGLACLYIGIGSKGGRS